MCLQKTGISGISFVSPVATALASGRPVSGEERREGFRSGKGRDEKGRGRIWLGVSRVAALMLTDGVMNSVRSLMSPHADGAD